jgi:glycosyltransferase involved in cell wall biosynthesis
VIDVCICTYNPRAGTLRACLEALVRQRCDPGAYRVLLVDNGSTPPLTDELLGPLRAAGIEARLLREERLGLASARLRAIADTAGPWLLFLDDDNELRADFIREGLDFIAARPEVGCFGGRLLLPGGYRLARWTRDFIPYLGIKDVGSEVITGRSQDWGRWEPPGAGAWVRREVAESFRRRFGNDPRVLGLGRKGKKVLASCEDAVLMREAYRLGQLHAYNPRLVLYHHVDPERFRAGYLIRLLAAYGSSNVVVEILVKGRPDVPKYAKYYRSLWRFWMLGAAQLWRARKTSMTFAIAMVAYHWNARRSFLDADRPAPVTLALPVLPSPVVGEAGPRRAQT